MRIAIIGASGHYPYVLEGAALRNDIEIAAVAPGTFGEDISGLVQRCVHKGFQPKEYGWWTQLLDAEQIDIAAINPWYCDSAAIAMECLKRGIHVYSEKPLATDLHTLDALKEVYLSSPADLGAMYDGRHTTWLRTAKKAIDAGLIGKVRLLHGQKSYKMGVRGEVYYKIKSYGGMLAWIAIHPVSWFSYVLGTEPVWVSAQTDTHENGGFGAMESTGCMLLRYPEGVLATINADFYRPTGAPRHDDDRIRITGTRGMIEVIDGRAYLENENGRTALEPEEDKNPFLYFADAIGTECAKEQAREAFVTARACLLARDAADEGGAKWLAKERM
ncbi:MAG: Gfo/Idh/MocA family oxidoreductase [Clostridia bacterium]|nr:Gfo/Idh/MocA family oxidoreductase [Clostridia bacterium]